MEIEDEACEMEVDNDLTEKLDTASTEPTFLDADATQVTAGVTDRNVK